MDEEELYTQSNDEVGRWELDDWIMDEGSEPDELPEVFRDRYDL